MACNCEGNKYNINFGCCTPVVANANHYYTKSEVDEKLEEIVISGGVTSGEVQSMIDASIPENVSAFNNDVPYLTEHQSLSGYATQQWVEDQGYLTEHQSLEGYVTENDLTAYTYDKQTIDEKVASGGTFDPTQYYTKEEIDAMLDDKATKTWVLNQHFVTNSELIQYINNLQIQINSLQESISGCCGGGGSGETIYRWITMTGDNDYECSGTTKYTKEKKQQSTDNGVTWEDVTPSETRRGNTVLEENSVDCGYVPTNLKFSGVLYNGNNVEVPCNSSTTLSSAETRTTNAYTSIVIGNCVSVIGDTALASQVFLKGHLELPSSIREIEHAAFRKCDGLSGITFNEGLETIGQAAFTYCTGFTSVVIPNSVTSIGQQAFYLHHLHTITIGSGVTSIGSSAFDTTDDIESNVEYVKIYAVTPPTVGANAFHGSYPIYVPSTSVNAYKSAWASYASRIQPIQ